MLFNYLIHAIMLFIRVGESTRKKGSAFTDHLLHAHYLFRLSHLILITSLGDKHCYPYFTDEEVDTQQD